MDRLRRKLPCRTLLPLAEKFSYRKGEKTLLERAADFRNQGYLTGPQASELVKWKTDRQAGNFSTKNSDEAVKRATAAAAGLERGPP